MAEIQQIPLKTIKGDDASLADYAGKVVLVVNVASKCGLTPQYEGLEELYQQFKDRDFEVLGFPCNQFGAQEPGDAAEIAHFCALTYDVSFPVMAKIDVNGDNADPLFAWLKGQAPGVLGTKAIKWNFTKFLVWPDGTTVKRYGPQTSPDEVRRDAEEMLHAPS